MGFLSKLVGKVVDEAVDLAAEAVTLPATVPARVVKKGEEAMETIGDAIEGKTDRDR